MSHETDPTVSPKPRILSHESQLGSQAHFNPPTNHPAVRRPPSPSASLSTATYARHSVSKDTAAHHHDVTTIATDELFSSMPPCMSKRQALTESGCSLKEATPDALKKNHPAQSTRVPSTFSVGLCRWILQGRP